MQGPILSSVFIDNLGVRNTVYPQQVFTELEKVVDMLEARIRGGTWTGWKKGSDRDLMKFEEWQVPSPAPGEQ